jgi:tetratricopeptide (TPR) repeat protein
MSRALSFVGLLLLAAVGAAPAPAQTDQSQPPVAVGNGVGDFNAGLEAARRGDNAAAIAHLSRAIDGGDLPLGSLARAFNNRGVVYDRIGLQDRALADYDAAIALEPNYVYARYNRGALHNDRGDYDAAIADFDVVLTQRPNLALAYNQRGAAFHNKGLYGRAIEDFSHALRLDPKLAEAYVNRARTYAAITQRDRAIADLRTASSLLPPDDAGQSAIDAQLKALRATQ